MSKITKKALCIFVVVLIAMVSAIAVAAEDVTITGTVTEGYQIVDDNGTVYDVAETEKGDEIVELVGKKVEVMGTVVEDGGSLIITIVSYTVIEE